jgi:site-specific DNA-methyltransferase (adenine-specific)
MAKKPDNTRKLSADKIVLLPLAEIRPYDKNPRKNANAVKYVKESIRQFGFKVPIVIDSNRVIVCGHTRLLAAKSLGMTEVPCIMADDLTDDQVKAFRLADNKVGEFAEWDLDLLGDELDAIADASDIDMGDFGFDLSGDDEETEVVEDEVPEEVEPICNKGDIWQLGEHRLLCGDSTSSNDVSKLMNGEIADIAFTSPPYNAGQTPTEVKMGKRTKYNGNEDDKDEDNYTEFLCKYLENTLNNSKYSFMNIQSLSNNKKSIIDLMYKFRNKFCDTIIWDKTGSQPAMANNVLNSEFEYIHIFGGNASRAVGTIPFRGTISNILHLAAQRKNEFSKIHNATFSVDFAEYFVKKFAKESVLDLFGGTGTTLIACEQLGRKCFMMELDPHYCDVIIARWEKLTGEKAVKVED